MVAVQVHREAYRVDIHFCQGDKLGVKQIDPVHKPNVQGEYEIKDKRFVTRRWIIESKGIK